MTMTKVKSTSITVRDSTVLSWDPPPSCFAENNSRQKASTIIRLASLFPFPERSQSCPACCPIFRNISWYILLNLQVMTAVLSLVPITSSWLETKFPLLNLFEFAIFLPLWLRANSSSEPGPLITGETPGLCSGPCTLKEHRHSCTDEFIRGPWAADSQCPALTQ